MLMHKVQCIPSHYTIIRNMGSNKIVELSTIASIKLTKHVVRLDNVQIDEGVVAVQGS